MIFDVVSIEMVFEMEIINIFIVSIIVLSY